MALTVNLRHLASEDLLLKGELTPEEVDLGVQDKVIRVTEPLRYELQVQRLDQSLLLQGRLALDLDCACVRCLKPFKYRLELPDWTFHVPLEGEDAAAVTNDSVDLTPFLREDILLAFPQHPLCDSKCEGLNAGRNLEQPSKPWGTESTENDSTTWSELDKLKF
jgi:uncharacterized metal-binding protein YceD (DUF177 family)